jgi:hypothetical protein
VVALVFRQTMAETESKDGPPAVGNVKVEHGEAPVKKETNGDDDAMVGSAAIAPIFIGNLMPESTDHLTRLFEDSSSLSLSLDREYRPFPVDHIDLKRGYCFVFLKDADSQSFKDDIEAFVKEINGM